MPVPWAPGIAQGFCPWPMAMKYALCDIKQELADGGKAKISEGSMQLPRRQRKRSHRKRLMQSLAKITTGLKEDLCADCDLVIEAAS